MTTWQKFNDAMEQLIDEGADVLQKKLDSKEIGRRTVDNLSRQFIDHINSFYSKLDDELVKGYDPANFDLTAAIKDLTVGMLETFVHVGTGGATAVVKAAAKQIAIDSAKRLAGFDGPSGEFKSPMDRTIEATTKVLGDNAIGRTVGRIVGLLEDLFNPNKARDEFYRIRAELQKSNEEISGYVQKKLGPLREQGLKVSEEMRGADIKANLKPTLKKKLDAFVKRMKDFPVFARALRDTLVAERNVGADYLPNLIKESYAFVNSPPTAEDSEIIGTSGLREKWREINYVLESQKFRATSGLERFGVKPTSSGFYILPDPSKIYGFDPKLMWFSSATTAFGERE